MFQAYPPYASPSSTVTDEEYSQAMFADAELRNRVFSWLMGIESLNAPHDLGPSSGRPRSRPSKPYARPEKRRRSFSGVQLNGPPELHNYWTTQEPPAAILCDIQQNLPDYRVPAHIQFRGLNDLPDPQHNPLVTYHPDDLREEYYRIICLYNTLEEKKQQAEVRWLNCASPAAMQEIMDVGSSIQRVATAAQYVIDFAIHCGIDMAEFDKIFLRYRCPPLKQPASCAQWAHVPAQQM